MATTTRAVTGMAALVLMTALGCSSPAANRPPAGSEATPSRPPPPVRPVDLNATRDYIYPPASAALRSQAVPAVPAAPDGATVTYVTFGGEILTLRRFNGLRTALLMRQADVDQAGMARVRRVVDEQDILYETMRDVTGGEPAGDGDLLRVAVVDNTCGGGCGLIGVKGVEILTPVFFIEDYIGYINHEMGHNFDRRSNVLFTSSDQAHSWTAFWDQYTQIYPRRGFYGLNADDVLELRIRERLGPYEALPGASWEACVRDAVCDPPGEIEAGEMTVLSEGGPILRIAQLYGPRVMKRWMPAVDRLVAERALDPGAMTQQDRIDLLVESLSLAAGADLGCFYDFWRWPLSAAVRGRLAFLGENALCQDADRDGFSPIQHDCNDASPTVSPSAPETVNGVDDDCDRVVDDVLMSEMGDFPGDPSPLPVPLPVLIRGTITNPGDEDHFRVHLDAPTSVRFTVVSRDTVDGWLFVNRQDNSGWLTFQFFGPGRISVLKLDLAAGDWVFYLGQYMGTGDYEITVQPDYPLPMAADYWPVSFTPKRAMLSPTDPREVLLPIPEAPSSLAGTSDLYAEYWISGLGFVGQTPVYPKRSFPVTVPEGTDLRAATYRVRFGAEEVPVHPLSQPASLLEMH